MYRRASEETHPPGEFCGLGQVAEGPGVGTGLAGSGPWYGQCVGRGWQKGLEAGD